MTFQFCGLNEVATDVDNDFWFFKKDQCVKLAKNGQSIATPQSAITSQWTALSPPFDRKLDGVTRVSDGWWFFRGGQCTKVGLDKTSPSVLPDTIVSQFPFLANNSFFADSLDTVTVDKDGNFWFFKDEKCIWIASTRSTGGQAQSITDAFPALGTMPTQTPTQYLDAVAFVPEDGWWLFKDFECAETNVARNSGKFTDGIGNKFPALEGNLNAYAKQPVVHS